jgi:hypothetical protein
MLSTVYSLISILLAFLIPGGHGSAGIPSHGQALPQSKARALKAYAALPMSFEMNQGQTDPSVGFLARGQGYTIYLKPSEAVLALQSPEKGHRFPARAQDHTHPSIRVLRMRIEGANPSAPATGLERLPGISNYFIGNDPRRWRTHIPTFKQVQVDQVRPGVSVVYYGNRNQLEYDFILSPGVRPQSLGLSFEGSDASLDRQGNLVFDSTGGQVSFHRPLAYQYSKPDSGKKHYLNASYVLKGHNRVGFDVTGYDPHATLVIDPSLFYSTYLGGNGGDTGNAIAVDSVGDAFITGSTASSNFPTVGSAATSPPYQKTYGGDTDAFVTMVRYDGEVLVYSTYLGGNNYDVGNGIDVDSSGDAYVTGSTSSANFPNTPSNVFQIALGGFSNAFVAKLDPSGSKLLYSTFLGGSSYDYGLALAIDQYGNAYVTGSTQSPNFPVLNAIQSGYSGNGDAFVTEVNTQGTELVYSTYLGGSSLDSGQGIAVDPGGNAYVTGYTFSTNFPIYNAYQSANGGGVDAFVTKISALGTALGFSTYLGGKGNDYGYAIALDSELNIYVAGSTLTACTPATTITTYCSPISTFPTTPGAYQTYTTKQAPGYSAAFLTKLNYPGTALLYSTLLGGSLTDVGSGVVVDGLYNAYVTGYTESNDFPTANAVQASYLGGSCGAAPCPDAFVTEVNAPGTSLVYSTFLAGSGGANFGTGIAYNSYTGNIYVAGTTTSLFFPATGLAYQGQAGNTTGLGQAFVSSISPTNAPSVALTPQKINFGNVNENTTTNLTATGQPATVTLTNAGNVPLQISSISTGGDFAQTNTCGSTVPAGGGSCTINVTFTPTVLVAETQLLSIADNAEAATKGNPQEVTLTGTGINEVTTVQFTPISLTFGTYTMGTTSPPQTVTMTNNGQTPLTITNISTTGDFAETNNCPISSSLTQTNSSLPVGQSCSFQVTFTPTKTGTDTGSLVVTDNVSSGTSSIPLVGTGNPVFNLVTPSQSESLTIGTTTTTYPITLTAASTFTDTIALTCSGSGASCSFNPTEIALGSTIIPSASTLTIQGLSAGSPNPTFVTVNGSDLTTSIGTATLLLELYFSDFSISATPAVNTVVSGAATIYTITVSPVNAFNQPVALSCVKSTLPQGTGCIFSPAALTPNGAAATSSTLTVSTTAQSTTNNTQLIPKSRPRIPPGPTIMLILWGASTLMMLAAFLRRRKMERLGRRRRPRYVLALIAFATLVLASAFWVSCEDYYYTNVIQPSTVNGTPTGNYKIAIDGTFTGTTAGVGVISGGATSVTHQTTVNLVVQ